MLRCFTCTRIPEGAADSCALSGIGDRGERAGRAHGSPSFTLAGTTDRHPDDHCPQRYGIRRRHCCRVALAACGRSLLRLCLTGQAASPCSACAGAPHSSRSSRLTSFLCLTRRRLSVHQQTKTIDSHATEIEADCNSIVAWRDCGELFETGSPRPSEGTRSAVSNRI